MLASTMPIPFSPRRLVGAALVAVLALPSCDSPACVFSGNCGSGGGGGGGLGESAASVPADSNWLSPAAPTVQSFYPALTQIASTTPIAIVFSESLSPASVGQAFELALVEAGAQSIPLTGVLVGDGRVVVLLPPAALLADTEYSVRLRAERNIFDLQGSRLVPPSDGEFGSFKTAATDPATPRVVMSFPEDNTINQSRTGESVVLFDRPVNVPTGGWLVTVAGQPPSPNPAPTSLAINLGQGSLDEKRVWRWRSADASGHVAPFPLSSIVALRLSPAAAPITAVTGTAALVQTDLDYTVAPFGAPLSVDVGTYDNPLDYIGAAALDGLDPLAALALEVWLFGSDPDDYVRVYLVGNDTSAQPELLALYREIQLGSLASYDIFPLQHESGELVVLGPAELDLGRSLAPLALRFAEGELSIAISLRRGNVTTPIKLLDVDRATLGIQQVAVDITAPQFVGFGSSGANTTTFSSDSVDLVVVGRANEELRAAEVVVGSATNGTEAACVSVRSDGLFVAAPLPFPGGLTNPLAGTTPFRVTIYDRAFNPAVSTTFADYVQVGAVGPGPGLPSAGALVSVQVHDARTFAPVPNARVFVHENLGPGSDTFVDTALTNALGTVTLGAAPTGETVITVDADGYDLWSYMGLPVGLLRVPLARSAENPAALSGTVTSSSALASFQRSVSDARRNESSAPFTSVAGCTSVGPASVCQYGPLPLVPGPLGALAFFAVENPISSVLFSPASYLRGFALDLPLPALAPQSSNVASLTTTVVLSDASTSLEDRAVAGPSAVLDISASIGFATANQSGSPRVSIEGLSPGIRAPLTVGSGIALDSQGIPPTAWSVRSALPGAADPTNGKYPGDLKGSLIRDGVLLPKLFLRTEVRDLAGSRIGLRTPLATTQPQPPLVLQPPSVPHVVAPLPSATTAGSAYDVTFLDTLPSATGIYRVTLTDANRRRWVLWAPDTNATPTFTISLPDLAAQGGVPLVAGPVFASVSAFAWPNLDLSAFAFSELERRTEVVLDSATVTFTQP
ncbi:MAG: hypothetical protein FJ298_10445 [Planctomycetes bacterium]|nr:hypothetical protein [Planctomycetota bacterium]